MTIEITLLFFKCQNDFIFVHITIFLAPSAHFKELPEEERNRCIEAGCPIILHCEISDLTAQVSWLKDGVQVHSLSGVDIQSEGHLRKLVVQSADHSHSGVYSCGFADDVITFKVDVQGNFP